MHSTQFVAAVAALAGFAAAKTCSKDINVVDPNPVIDCEVVDADIIVDKDVAGDLIIDGPKQIKGDLIVNNATNLLSISSTTINSIGGKFQLTSLNSLNSIEMDSLRSVQDLEMIKLTNLRSLVFGTEGVTKANSVQISDTWIDNLSGLKLATVDSLKIDNNQRLVKFESTLVNVTTELIINNNGKGMEIDLDELESAEEIQIANVKAFRVPLLETVGASLKLDKCDNLESFMAPNLTKVKDAVSFINNKKLSNISLPLLKEIGGDLRIVNNTKLTDIDGFPKLETMASINFGGNFEKADMPALDTVPGTAEVSTSAKNEIGEKFCAFFVDADDDDKIKGGADCTYDNENALEGGETEGGQSGSGSGSSGKDDDEGAAGMISVNTALVGLGLLAGIAQLL